MATTIEQLEVRVTADTSQAEKGLSGIGEKAKSAGGPLQGLLGNMLGIAGGVSAANIAGKAFGFLSGQIGDVFSSAEQSQQVMAETNAVIKATHGAAGMSAQAVGDLATKLSNVTPFDDEVIQSTENMLLTFKNISSKTFPAASEAALDMAQKFKIGPEQAAVQLGKALNDPVQGISALNRVGVTFTDAQKKQVAAMVKAGDTAGAQKIILGELKSEMGGVARAAGETTAGKMAIFNTKIGNVKEAIGGALLPALSGALDAGMKLADGVQNLLGKVGDFASWLQAHQPVLDILKVVLAGLAIGAAIFVATTIPPLLVAFGAWAVSAGAAALATLAAAAPFIAVGLAIAGVIAIIVLLVSHGDQVKAFLGGIKDAVLGFLGGVLGAIGGFIGSVLGTIGDLAHKALDLYTWPYRQLLSFITNTAVPFMGRALQGLVNLAKNVASGIWNAIKGGINLMISGLNTFIRFIDSIQIHIPSIGVGPVHTPAFNWGGVGLGQLPYLASGGTILRGGYAVVGERGPEVVSLPAGAQVAPHGQGMGDTYNYTIQGADAQQVLSLLRRESLLLEMSGRA